jgi:DNA polymerase III subunit delta
MFYIFHGDDTFTQREELSRLVAKLGDPAMAGLNTVELEGSSIAWQDLLHHCSSIPFISDRRLVIVHGLLARLEHTAKRQTDARFLERLVDYLPDLPATTRLIFAEQKELSPKHPVIALARSSQDGYEKTITRLTGSTLTRWVQQRVSREGGEIARNSAQMLCTYVEEDLYQLTQEIQKLVAYTDGQRPITEADIQLLTPRARQANIFHMVDALGRRDGRSATAIYHRLLESGDHPLALLGMITRQFRLMIQVKELAPELGTPKAIARELGQNPYPIRKILTQSDNYTMSQLHAVYHKLLDTDLSIKTGRTEPVLALDLLIAGLSRAA